MPPELLSVIGRIGSSLMRLGYEIKPELVNYGMPDKEVEANEREILRDLHQYNQTFLLDVFY
jgi:hypothetical protein